jgi:hypothetical protein
MYHPTRGGVRGGKDQFDWANVKTDKDRECYLGHSLMAPVGRWQDGKDLTWYAKENKVEQDRKKTEEFMSAKKAEEDALMAALGFRVVGSLKIFLFVRFGPTSMPTPFVEKPKQVEIKQEKTDDVKPKQLPMPKGPQMHLVKSADKNDEQLDKILLALLKKHKISEIFDALRTGKSDKSSKKKKKSKSKTKKRRSRDRTR